MSPDWICCSVGRLNVLGIWVRVEVRTDRNVNRSGCGEIRVSESKDPKVRQVNERQKGARSGERDDSFVDLVLDVRKGYESKARGRKVQVNEV